MNKMSLLMIFIIGIILFVASFGLYIYFFTGSEYVIKDKIIGAWYTGESIRLNGIDHWWVTVEFEDNIPQMYFFRSDNVFNDNGKQKADNAWEKIEPLIGSEVQFEYKIQYKGNELKYFKGISDGDNK